jgi:hypothetical protein
MLDVSITAMDQKRSPFEKQQKAADCLSFAVPE